MNKETKIKIKLLNEIIAGIKIELKQKGDSIDDEALKGSQRYTIKLLQCWKEIVRDEEKQSLKDK